MSATILPLQSFLKFLDMVVTNHQIEPRTQPRMHAASSVSEVTEWSREGDINEAFAGDGFYFWDETEAAANGPYDTLEEAVTNRNTYFEHLQKSR